MLIRESMIAKIEQLSRSGNRVGILLIDMFELESGDVVPSHVRNMQTVLMYAIRENLPIWMIELPPSGGSQNPSSQTTLFLRGLLPQSIRAFIKPRFNAFDGTDLLQQLRKDAVTSHIVVMGHEANCCVKQTAVGGSYRRGKEFVFGAIQHGYTVLTCDQILSANGFSNNAAIKADWWNEPQVEYYTSL